MARPAKITSAILNVRLHPHSPAIYAAFVTAIYRRKRAEKIHGDRYGMLSSLDRSKVDEGWISGIITTFTRIEKDGTWFDEDGLEEATEEQLSSIAIPADLLPVMPPFIGRVCSGYAPGRGVLQTRLV